MRRTLEVLFRADANSTIGMGHLMRCCALAAALDRLIACSCHFERSAIEHARATLAANGTEVTPASDDQSYDITIIDLRLPAHGVVEGLRSRSHLLVAIDDDPTRDLPVDVVVQPNAMPSERSRGSAVRYSGLDFILLHPAYNACGPSPIGDAVQRALICFGGSDPADLSLRLSHVLQSLDVDASYRLALGPCYENVQEVERVAALVQGMEILRGVPTLAEEMASCDLAIVSGGTLLYEACALGRPALVLSQNEEQAQEAAVFARHDAIVDLGRHDRVSDSDIADGIRQLWKDPARRRRLAERAKCLVPVSGAARAAERILHHFEQHMLMNGR